MKKITLFTLFMVTLLNLSCSNDSTDETTSSINIENKIVERHFFTYKNQILTISLTKDEKSGELVPIENDSFQLLNEINEINESLITYVLDDTNFILFENEKDLLAYVSPVVSMNKNTSTKLLDPYDSPYSLRIYSNSDYNNEVTWHSNYPPIYSNGNHTSIPNGCYFEYGTNSERLQNFSNISMWQVFQGSFLNICGSNEFIGNNPNDKISSIRVSSCYARCYEDSNFGGRSFVLDARGSVLLQISNLKNLRRASWGRNWNDEISSVSLSY
ncbi:hypothetical protein ACFQ0I_16725 [Mariniflexile aquimaris]|uniref:Lipoprotein n=1 Tax=Mariniflexile aquimaris TaxID=881009 RepID=A0ABW3BXZ6_9FLAO